MNRSTNNLVLSLPSFQEPVQPEENDAARIVDAALHGLWWIDFGSTSMSGVSEQRKTVQFADSPPEMIPHRHHQTIDDDEEEDSNMSAKWFNDSDLSCFKLGAVQVVLQARRDMPCGSCNDRTNRFFDGSDNDLTGLSKYVDATDLASAESKTTVVRRTLALQSKRHLSHNDDDGDGHEDPALPPLHSCCHDLTDLARDAALARATRTFEQVYGEARKRPTTMSRATTSNKRRRITAG